MRKFYSLVLCLGSLWGYSQIQSEDFETSTMPAGWEMNVITGTAGWTFGVSEYGGGYQPFTSNGAMFDDDLNEEYENEADLISPPVNVTSYATLSLSFNYSLEDYAGSGDFFVYVWNGTAWIQVFTQTSDMLFEAKTIDVTAYKNAAFRVKFKYLDDDWGWGAGVDQFRLTGTPLLAVNETEAKKIAVGPNPVQDQLTFFTDKKVTNIMLYDSAGNKVSYHSMKDNVLDVSSLKTGMYFITYEINGKVYKDKMMKK